MPQPETTQPTARKLADKLFLGPEFLTWLYFAISTDAPQTVMTAQDIGTSYAGDGSDLIGFGIGKRAKLADVGGAGARVGLAGPGVDGAGEVLAAIRRGALLTELALEMAIESRVYGFTLRADGAVVGLKLPDLFTEPEDDATAVEPAAKPKRRPKLPLEDVLALRAAATAEAETVVDALFARFMHARVDRVGWARELDKIRMAVTAGLVARAGARA